MSEMSLHEVYKGIGGHNKRQEITQVFECPNCHYRAEGLNVKDGNGTCYKCNRVYPIGSIPRVQVYQQIQTCNKCKQATPVYENGNVGAINRCIHCQNILGVTFESSCRPAEEVLSSQWNCRSWECGSRLEGAMVVAQAKSNEELCVMSLFHSLAELDGTGSSFLAFRPDDQEGLLFLLDKIPNGYLVWCELEQKILLNQLFILEGKRRQGYGSAIVKHWVEDYVLDRFDEFLVDSPGEEMESLLTNLGYMDGSAHIQCDFVYGM